MGHDVVVCDVDQKRVERIQRGLAPIHEVGLEGLLIRNVGKRLRATTDLAAAVERSDLTLIAVGTPSEEGRIDLTALVRASQEVGAALAAKDSYHVVVVKSTVVPGTTAGVVRPLLEEAARRKAGDDFGVGVNPEFLTEGQAVADFLMPDRLVLGGIDQRTVRMLDELYASFPLSVPRVRTNPTTAEMIKYASNGLLATMISFANEIGNLCAAVGNVDVIDVMEGVHLSRYLSPLAEDGAPVRAPIVAFLETGCGFGGSCLPKDVRALIATGEGLGQPMRVMRAVIDTNMGQPEEVLRLVEEGVGDLSGRRVTVLGLAFKPDTDDTRESPALPIVERLLARGAIVTAHDPLVRVDPNGWGDRVKLSSDLSASLDYADAVVLVTRWEHYGDLPALLAEMEHPPLLVDGRRMFPVGSVQRYAGVGRQA
jgi:UDPglucose 6-dehydrogenase/GDP-mannose 6-dehydrogenase